VQHDSYVTGQSQRTETRYIVFTLKVESFQRGRKERKSAISTGNSEKKTTEEEKRCSEERERREKEIEGNKT